jgi:hypothetical protein
MTFEIDEKGKIFTDVVTKRPVSAIVQTTTHVLRGNIHVHPQQRLKDELDRDEMFLAMTDVQVLGADGAVIRQTEFLAVQRSQIVWVTPAEEAKERETK